jgi:hypothetical protein
MSVFIWNPAGINNAKDWPEKNKRKAASKYLIKAIYNYQYTVKLE